MPQAIDHVNIVVRDLEMMTDFYTAGFGFTVTRRVTISGDWIGSVVGLDGVVGHVVYLTVPDDPDGTRIELIRYESPEGVRIDGNGIPNACGIRHVALRVSDIAAALSNAAAAGAEPFGPITEVPGSQVTYAGGKRKKIVYLHDPEGNIVELCCYE